VFIDINKDTLQIDLTNADSLLTDKTKAIMVTHLFGLSSNMTDVLKFAKSYNLRIIEDAAQAIGVSWGGQHCGTFGDVGCFSFFADKTITTGEGGFVTTSNEETHNKLLFLRNQGRLNRGSFIHPEIGYNFRITDIQAAVGVAQLNKLKDIIKKKINLLNLYKEKLNGISSLKILSSYVSSNHVPFRVVIFSKSPISKLMDFLKNNNVETRTLFYPLHLQPCYKNLNADRNFPNSIYCYEHGMCLPSYPDLEEPKVDYICSLIKDFYA
jgi:perosamine synthetase